MNITRVCDVCGKEHRWVNSPICQKCRRENSKRKCPIDGCETLITERAKACNKHKHLTRDKPQKFCKECHKELDPPSVRGVCDNCYKNIFVLCACGCGRYRRKYNHRGSELKYVSGHNDSKKGFSKLPKRNCTMCNKVFQPKTLRQKLCGPDCRAKWVAINKVYERKGVITQCAVCGKDIYRAPYQLKEGKDHVCSKRCQYIVVANKLKGPKDFGKRAALQRDKGKCRICGFDVIVHVHHIKPKRNNGNNELDNLITLCPNHHAMADRKLISQKELKRYLDE